MTDEELEKEKAALETAPKLRRPVVRSLASIMGKKVDDDEEDEDETLAPKVRRPVARSLASTKGKGKEVDDDVDVDVDEMLVLAEMDEVERMRVGG